MTGEPPAAPPPELQIELGELLWYIDQALDSMAGILDALGDDLANRRPDLAGANSPYAIVTHCLGVLSYWGGERIADRRVVRHRDAEFRARGPVDELLARVTAARDQLVRDLDSFDTRATPSGAAHPEDDNAPFEKSKGGVVLHIYEELAQHLGHLELTRDVLVAAAGCGDGGDGGGGGGSGGGGGGGKRG